LPRIRGDEAPSYRSSPRNQSENKRRRLTLPQSQGNETFSYRPTYLGQLEIERGVQGGLAPSNRQFGQSENEHRESAPSNRQFGQSENERRVRGELAHSNRQFGQSENERCVQGELAFPRRQDFDWAQLEQFEDEFPRTDHQMMALGLQQPAHASSLVPILDATATHTSPSLGNDLRSARPASYLSAQDRGKSSQGNDKALRILPFTVPDPSTELDGDWVETANMPGTLVEALQARFEATLCDDAKKRRWSSYGQSEEDCIMTHAIGRGKNHSVFNDGRSKPCELCKKSKRLCAGLVENEGVLKIGLRLPDARFRGTDNWEQVEHYVYAIT
jgi:hypothetical protein